MVVDSREDNFGGELVGVREREGVDAGGARVGRRLRGGFVETGVRPVCKRGVEFYVFATGEFVDGRAVQGDGVLLVVEIVQLLLDPVIIIH